MNYSFFAGCKIPYFVPQYEIATRVVCSALNIQLVDVEFNCCGYPVRNLDFYSYLYSAARNLALAEKVGDGILTPCKCCFGSFKRAEAILAEREDLRDRINLQLAPAGLKYHGRLKIRHLLQVLYHEVGLPAIREKIVKPFDKPEIAVHYGCHALRPSKITEFDDPYNPSMFDQLVEATGAVSVNWGMRLDCCGNPLWQKNNRLSRLLARKKILDAQRSGAQYLCVACTYCQIQFDHVQQIMLEENEIQTPLPSILYPQLLGLAMGFSAKRLGLDTHRLDAASVVSCHAASGSRGFPETSAG
jgi:heterodisulfide reductase subunit B2